jgi:hypothetical protein
MISTTAVRRILHKVENPYHCMWSLSPHLVFASAAGMKSNHGFAKITRTDEENQKCYSNHEWMRAREKVRRTPYSGVKKCLGCMKGTWGPTGLPPEGSFSKDNRFSSTPGSSRTGHENILGVTACTRKKEVYRSG